MFRKLKMFGVFTTKTSKENDVLCDVRDWINRDGALL